MQIELKMGHQTVCLDVSRNLVSAVLIGEDVLGLARAAIAEIISGGVVQHAPPDLDKKKVAVIIPDDTRLWARGDLFVPVIVQSILDLGVFEKNVSIIIALGTHKDIKEDKFAQLAGESSVGRVRILNSANTNKDRLVFLGETRRKTEVYITREAVEADHIIIYGGVLHHMAAGYGGGRKYIFPGIAGYDSIQQNHSLAMGKDGSAHSMVCQRKLRGNPVHEDITEAAELFLEGKTCTYVAIAANGRGEIFHAEVGPLQETFQNSCRRLDEVCSVAVDKKEDFALISAGGFRADGQLYQSIKALFNSVDVVKEGGKIVLVAACSEGPGNEIFAETLKKYKDDQKSLGRRLVTAFSMPTYVAFRVLDILNRFEVTLVSKLSASETRELGFNYVKDLQSYVNDLQGNGYIIPYAENILPVAGKV